MAKRKIGDSDNEIITMTKRKRGDSDNEIITLDVYIRTSSKNDIFTILLSKIKPINELVVLRWRETGLFMTMMDTSHIGVIFLHIPAEWFDEYVLILPDGETEKVTNVQTWVLNKAMSIGDPKNNLRIRCKGHEVANLEMSFTDTEGSLTKRFELPFIENDEDKLLEDVFQSDVEFEVSSKRWAEDLKNMHIFGSSVRLRCSAETVSLTTESADTCVFTSHLGVDSISIVPGSVHEECFGLKLLLDLAAFENIAKTLEIHLTKNRPLRIVFLMLDNIRFTCYVVARVKDDD